VVRTYKIGVIRGDGVGPEVIGAALRLLALINRKVELVEINAGHAFFRRTGKLIEDRWLDKVKEVEAIIKGPLTTLPGPGTHRSVNVMLRQRLKLYANIRPFEGYRGVSLNDRINLTIVRENTEGLYAGLEGRFKDYAFTVRVVTREGSLKIIKHAFRYALSEGFRRVTAVHKANILKESDGLFREVFREVSVQYPTISTDEVYVDAAAYYLIKNPLRFGVIVTPNLYGDILSDLAAGLTGSLGLCGSAQVGDDIAVFEPVHGSAPDIAGRGIANPAGAIIALTLMLKYLGKQHSDRHLTLMSSKIKLALRHVIESKKSLTTDIGGSASTEEFLNAVIKVLEENT